MAVPFYLPEGGPDDTNSSAGGSSSSSDGASSASSQSPNTTSSATQTPMQSPLIVPGGEQFVMAFCEALYRCSMTSGATPPVFQYPTPPSPSCSVHSPTNTGGDVFFPRARSTPRTPRTSVSFASGEEINFFPRHPAFGMGGSSQSQSQQYPQPPQSAPPMHSNSHYHLPQYYHCPNSNSNINAAAPSAYSHYQYTPPPTPTTVRTSAASTTSVNAGTGMSLPNMNTSGATTTATTSTSTTTARLHRSHSDAARRSRLTSTGEDEREYQSEHETSWDEFDDRYDNFTAGRERLQEFNGRIPPRKKKKDVPKSKPEKKEQSFTWPTVVTVFVFAMGCGFLVAR